MLHNFMIGAEHATQDGPSRSTLMASKTNEGGVGGGGGGKNLENSRSISSYSLGRSNNADLLKMQKAVA
jgi:hypothetical protein